MQKPSDIAYLHSELRECLLKYTAIFLGPSAALWVPVFILKELTRQLFTETYCSC